MTHVYHQGRHAILLDSNEMNDLLVSLERGRKMPAKAKITDILRTPKKRVQGCDEGGSVATVDIAQFYENMAGIAKKVKP